MGLRLVVSWVALAAGARGAAGNAVAEFVPAWASLVERASSLLAPCPIRSSPAWAMSEAFASECAYGPAVVDQVIDSFSAWHADNSAQAGSTRRSMPLLLWIYAEDEGEFIDLLEDVLVPSVIAGRRSPGKGFAYLRASEVAAPGAAEGEALRLLSVLSALLCAPDAPHRLTRPLALRSAAAALAGCGGHGIVAIAGADAIDRSTLQAIVHAFRAGVLRHAMPGGEVVTTSVSSAVLVLGSTAEGTQLVRGGGEQTLDSFSTTDALARLRRAARSRLAKAVGDATAVAVTPLVLPPLAANDIATSTRCLATRAAQSAARMAGVGGADVDGTAALVSAVVTGGAVRYTGLGAAVAGRATLRAILERPLRALAVRCSAEARRERDRRAAARAGSSPVGAAAAAGALLGGAFRSLAGAARRVWPARSASQGGIVVFEFDEDRSEMLCLACDAGGGAAEEDEGGEGSCRVVSRQALDVGSAPPPGALGT